MELKKTIFYISVLGFGFCFFGFAFAQDRQGIKTHIRSFENSRFQVDVPSSSSGFSFDGCSSAQSMSFNSAKIFHCDISLKADPKSFVVFKVRTLDENTNPGSCEITLKIIRNHHGPFGQRFVRYACEGSFLEPKMYIVRQGVEYDLIFIDSSASKERRK